MNYARDLLTSILFSVVSTVLCGYIFADWQLGVIAGLITGLYAYAFSLYKAFSEKNEGNEKRVQSSLNKLSELLRISHRYYNNEWLHKYLMSLISVHQESEKHQMFLTLTEQEIRKGLIDVEEIIRGGKIHYNGWTNENKRMQRLGEFVAGSKKYVKAVTSYDPTYWEYFWLNESFSKDYTQSNIDAANTGTKIDRIFILPNEVLNGKNEKLCNTIKKIVNPMKNKKNLNIHFVSSEDLPKPLSSYQHENFFVSDDLFIGYSNNFSDKDKTNGHVTINNQKEVDDMLDKFNDLLVVSKPVENYTFLGG